MSRSTSADAYTISAVIISMNRGWGGVALGLRGGRLILHVDS
jgi:hypothetical protein